MRESRFGCPLRRVSAFEGARNSSVAPRFCTLYQAARETNEVVDLESESPERISGERIESGGNQNEVGDKALGSCINCAFQRCDVTLRGLRSGHRHVPHAPMWAAILGGTCPRIPRPLVHRNEMNVGLRLDERLRAIAVMNVPVDYQDSLCAMFFPRVMRCNSDVAEEAEPHRAAGQSMMTGRTDGTEAPGARFHRAVDCIENASGPRCRSGPAPFAGNSVGVEVSATCGSEAFDSRDVIRRMRQSELRDDSMSPLDLFDAMEKLGGTA